MSFLPVLLYFPSRRHNILICFYFMLSCFILSYWFLKHCRGISCCLSLSLSLPQPLLLFFNSSLFSFVLTCRYRRSPFLVVQCSDAGHTLRLHGEQLSDSCCPCQGWWRCEERRSHSLECVWKQRPRNFLLDDRFSIGISRRRRSSNVKRGKRGSSP